MILGFSSDGTLLASAGSDKVIRLWNVNTGKESQAFAGHERIISSFAFTGTDKPLYSADQETVHIWNVASGKKSRQFNKGSVMAYPFAFSPDGKVIASASRQRLADSTLRLWDARSVE